MNINPVEAVWLGVGLIAAVVTLLNLIDAEQARRAVFGTSRAWRIQAAANVRREVVSLVMAVGTVLIVVPSLGRPGDVEMTALILVFMSIPFGLAVNSIFDARTRRTLSPRGRVMSGRDSWERQGIRNRIQDLEDAARAAAPPVEPKPEWQWTDPEQTNAGPRSPDPVAGLREALLTEFDGSLCPACHCRAHDPGGCSNCPRCELHTDEAAAFVLRYEPALLASDKPGLDAERPEPWEIEAMIANGEEDSPDPVAGLREAVWCGDRNPHRSHQGPPRCKGLTYREAALLASDKPGLDENPCCYSLHEFEQVCPRTGTTFRLSGGGS